MFPLNGQKIADEILDRLRQKPKPKKFLAGVVIGQNPSSESFQNIKQKTAEKLGLDYRIYHLAEDLSQDKLRKEIGRIASHKTCGGVVVQLPLPDQINRHYVLNAVPREKDPDVLSERALGAFYTSRNRTVSRDPAHAGFYEILPPAAGTVSEIISNRNLPLATYSIAVVGPGFLVGRPIANWLAGKAKEILVLDQGSDLGLLKTCDLIITGTGVPGLIKPDMLKSTASVIDFGYGKNSEGILTGDFDSSPLFQETNDSPLVVSKTEPLVVSEVEPFYTPTPRGTGPILVAKLMENFYTLNVDPAEDDSQPLD